MYSKINNKKEDKKNMSLKTLNKKQKTICYSLLFVLTTSVSYFTLDSSVLRYYYNDINQKDVEAINNNIMNQEKIINYYSENRNEIFSIVENKDISNLDKKIAVNNLFQNLSKIDEGTANIIAAIPAKKFDTTLSEAYFYKGLILWQSNSSFKKYLNFINVCDKKWYCSSFVYRTMLNKKKLLDYRYTENKNKEILNYDIKKASTNDLK